MYLVLLCLYIKDGSAFLFFVVCSSAATSGKQARRLLSFQPYSLNKKGSPNRQSLHAQSAGHSWSSPFGHFHQTDLPLLAVTSLGFSSPFLVGCHSATKSGYSASNSRRLPAQKDKCLLCFLRYCQLSFPTHELGYADIATRNDLRPYFLGSDLHS